MGYGWTCPRRPREWSVGLKGLKTASELGCSGWRTEGKRGTLGSPALHRHLLRIPFLLSLAPEAEKEGDRDTQLNGQPGPPLHTQTPAPHPVPIRSDPGLNPPSKRCGFRPDQPRSGSSGSSGKSMGSDICGFKHSANSRVALESRVLGEGLRLHFLYPTPSLVPVTHYVLHTRLCNRMSSFSLKCFNLVKQLARRASRRPPHCPARPRSHLIFLPEELSASGRSRLPWFLQSR